MSKLVSVTCTVYRSRTVIVSISPRIASVTAGSVS